MAQFYSDPTRESDTYALPDARVFHAAEGELWDAENDPAQCDEPSAAGWYFDFCFPGCLPESDPFGPYATEQAAIDACREMVAQ